MPKMTITGDKQLKRELDQLSKNIENIKFATEILERDMVRFVHIDTGFLKSTIFSDDEVAGATAGYAGVEADRGGEHDYAQLAIDAFNMEEYADKIWRAFG